MVVAAVVGFLSHSSVTKVFWLSRKANGQRLVMTVIRCVSCFQGLLLCRRPFYQRAAVA